MDVPGAVHGDAGWECEFCICSRSPVPRKVICAVSRDGCDRASRGYLANATAVDVCDIQIASTVHSHAPRSIECRTIRRSSVDRKSTRLNSSHGYISYAVFCLKKKKNTG